MRSSQTLSKTQTRKANMLYKHNIYHELIIQFYTVMGKIENKNIVLIMLIDLNVGQLDNTSCNRRPNLGSQHFLY